MSALQEARDRARKAAEERETLREQAQANREVDETRTIRTPEELRRLAEVGATQLGGSGIGAADEATYNEVLQWVTRVFGYRTAVACSMADAVLPHLVATHIPFVDVLFLETGYHFPETLGTRDAVATTMNVSVIDVTPELTVAQQDAKHGANLWQRDPASCCAMRKVEPIHRALGQYEVWITGVRRDEAPTRAQTPLVTFDDTNGLVKVNPLAAWSFDDLMNYAQEHNVITNPLLADGYPSIGCAPCTRRVQPGEDPRAGRWAGLAKTECGLHV